VVTEKEIGVRKDLDLGIRAEILVLLRNVRLRELRAVNVNTAIVDAHTIAFDGNHPLDIALGRIARIVKDDDVAALDGPPTINELVDEDALLVLKTRKHAGAFDFHGLIEEYDDEARDDERDEQITYPRVNRDWLTSNGRICALVFCHPLTILI
jgi:hypothetical protein